MNRKQYKYIVAITFVWFGFVGAISFMEAWLKFQAPDITLKLGLGIGQLVFGALNRVEIICAIIIIGFLIFLKGFKNKEVILFIIPLIILSMQTFWLLPALSSRIDLILQDIQVPESKLHVVYIVIEFLKIICLWFFGMQTFKIQVCRQFN